MQLVQLRTDGRSYKAGDYAVTDDDNLYGGKGGVVVKFVGATGLIASVMQSDLRIVGECRDTDQAWEMIAADSPHNKKAE